MESGRARATDRGSGGLGLAKGYVIGWLFFTNKEPEEDDAPGGRLAAFRVERSGA